MAEYQDAFISYGRVDSKEFAQYLYDHLSKLGLKVWFDFADIPLGVDYQRQIDDGIEKAHNFLFLISPHSVNSPYCGLEVELALRYNKRIIPILHVEQISQETWQRRFPQGTEADWYQYQAAGKHSCFPNMHPAIAKINWIYMRDGQDDVVAGLEGLRSVLERHHDYVVNHTHYLNLALTWDRNQQRLQDLLRGEMLGMAVEWLHREFTQEQPPCVPTDLHCEFITKSLRFDRNQRSQVYLCYADENLTVANHLYRDLLRQGWVVWNHRVDSNASTLEEDVFQAIEMADNFLYCLSPHTLQSRGCQKELAHAFNLRKRIITVEVQVTESKKTRGSSRSHLKSRSLDRIYDRLESDNRSSVVEAFQSTSKISLLSPGDPDAYGLGLKQIIQELGTDADFYHEQTEILVRSLQWKAHRFNPHLLLQGHQLNQALSWWQLAQQSKGDSYTPLQEDYLRVSGEQTPATSWEVFLLYASVDEGFARRIAASLSTQGRSTWLAWDQLAPDDPEYREGLKRGLWACSNCVVIGSPSLFQDDQSRDLLGEAMESQKRLIPVLHLSFDITMCPEVLRDIDWIDFAHQVSHFYTSVGELIRHLNLDRDYVQEHSKWSSRSRAWVDAKQSEDLLLRGHELNSAESWLQTSLAEPRVPPVTTAQREFIQASSEARDRRLYLEEQKRQQELIRARRWTIASSLMGAMMAGMALFSTLQLRKAEIETIETLRVSAELLFREGQELQAMVNALKANQRTYVSFLQKLWPHEGLKISAQGTLQEISLNIDEYNQIPAEAFSLSAQGNTFAVHQPNGTVQIWEQPGGKVQEWTTHRNQVGVMAFSPNLPANQALPYLALAGESGLVSLWDTNRAEKLAEWQAHGGQVTSLSFRADGESLLTSGKDGKAYRWSLAGNSQAVFTMSGQKIKQAVFNPQGDRILTVSDQGQGALWDDRGYPLAQWGQTHALLSFAFSPDGRYLLTGHKGGFLQLHTRDGELLEERKISVEDINVIAFSPKFVDLLQTPGKTPPDADPVVATGSADGIIRLWDGLANLEQEIYAHTGGLQHLQFSSDGTRLVSLGEEDGILRFWDLNGRQQLQFQANNSRINSLALSPDDHFLLALTQAGQARAWLLQGHQHAVVDVYGDKVKRVMFNPQGTTLATLSQEGVMELWNLDGSQRDHWEQVKEMIFSSNGYHIAWLDQVQTLYVSPFAQPLKADTSLQFTPPPDQDWQGLRFSPNGDYIGIQSSQGEIWMGTVQGDNFGSFRPHARSLQTFTFHPQDQRFITTDDRGEMRFWAKPNQLIWKRTLEAPEGNGGIYFVQFSPNGDQFITAQWDGQVSLWDTDTGEPVQDNYHAHSMTIEGEVMEVQFPSNNEVRDALFLVKQTNSHLQLQKWGGELLKEFRHQGEGVQSASFIPGTPWILTLSWAGTARLWHRQGYKLLGIQDHYGQVTDMAMSPDRRLLLTGGGDGLAKFWEISSHEELVYNSCQWLRDYLSTLTPEDPDAELCPDTLQPPASSTTPENLNSPRDSRENPLEPEDLP